MQHVIAWLNEQQNVNLQRLARWCNTNSWSLDQPRLVEMANQLCEDFSQIGVDFERKALPPIRVFADDGGWREQPTGPALLYHRHPEAARRVLLMIHYDTVYRVNQPPTVCQVHDDRLLGPGTADAKGGIATIYAAISAMQHFQIATKFGISILLNPDEEIGSPATRSLLEELAPKFEAALLFEPTLPDGSLAQARKGSGNFSFIVHGRSAHAGRNPHAGLNAIVHAGRLIERLANLNDPQTNVQLNVGNAFGGGPLNQVPARAVVQVNARVATVPSQRHVLTQLAEITRDLSIGGFQVEMIGEFHAPPKVPDEAFRRLQSIVEQASATLGKCVCWQDTGGACDGNKLAALGIPNIDTLGVTGDHLHSSDEFMLANSLPLAAARLMAILKKWRLNADHDPGTVLQIR